MMAEAVRSSRDYPRKAEIKRAVDAARACGLDVIGIKVSRDGAIEVIEARARPEPIVGAEDELARWEAEGRI